MMQESQASLGRCVMVGPATAYRLLAQQPARGHTWLGWRRVLLVAFVLGCTMSLITSGRLTLRLVAPATIYWGFVPLAETAALAVVRWPERKTRSFSSALDLFFA